MGWLALATHSLIRVERHRDDRTVPGTGGNDGAETLRTHDPHRGTAAMAVVLGAAAAGRACPAAVWLAQLWLDGSVPDPAAAFLAAHAACEPTEAAVIVVGLEGSPADQWLIRYGSCLAELSDARLHGVHVRPLDNLDRPVRTRLMEDRRLLNDLHETFTEVKASDPASGLIGAARKAGAAQLVIGSRRRSRWSQLLSGSTVADRVLRLAGDLPVQVVNVGRPDKTSSEWRRQATT
jgi:nucleotide-binding universal stress UspA family protein